MESWVHSLHILFSLCNFGFFMLWMRVGSFKLVSSYLHPSEILLHYFSSDIFSQSAIIPFFQILFLGYWNTVAEVYSMQVRAWEAIAISHSSRDHSQFLVYYYSEWEHGSFPLMTGGRTSNGREGRVWHQTLIVDKSQVIILYLSSYKGSLTTVLGQRCGCVEI